MNPPSRARSGGFFDKTNINIFQTSPDTEGPPASIKPRMRDESETNAMTAKDDGPFIPRAGLLLRLCAVGFFVNCQPSEPFLARYLMDDKGLTEAELDNYV